MRQRDAEGCSRRLGGGGGAARKAFSLSVDAEADRASVRGPGKGERDRRALGEAHGR